MAPINTLLFDFDGTLADTYPIIFYAFQKIFQEFNHRQITPKEIVAMFGPAENEIIRAQFPDYADVSPIIERYYELYTSHHDILVKPMSEINHMLDNFKERGYQLGIITGKGRRSLDISLHCLFPEALFAVTVAGDEVARPKPHPQGLLKALAVLHRTPDSAVFIGDSEFDFKAGKAAGIKTIGVSWFDNKGEFGWKNEFPHKAIKQTVELVNFVANQTVWHFPVN